MVSLCFQVPALRGHHLLRVLDGYEVSIRHSFPEPGDPIFHIRVEPESVDTVVTWVLEQCPGAKLLEGLTGVTS
jgi:hypothetical protein